MLTVRYLGIWAGLAASLALAPFGAGEAAAQGALKNVTYVQPNPSAINSFQVYVAIGEGYFRSQIVMFRRIDLGQAARQHCKRSAFGFQRPAMGTGVDPSAREAMNAKTTDPSRQTRTTTSRAT